MTQVLREKVESQVYKELQARMEKVVELDFLDLLVSLVCREQRVSMV